MDEFHFAYLNTLHVIDSRPIRRQLDIPSYTYLLDENYGREI
jgi:hypothetical protein